MAIRVTIILAKHIYIVHRGLSIPSSHLIAFGYCGASYPLPCLSPVNLFSFCPTLVGCKEDTVQAFLRLLLPLLPEVSRLTPLVIVVRCLVERSDPSVSA